MICRGIKCELPLGRQEGHQGRIHPENLQERVRNDAGGANSILLVGDLPVGSDVECICSLKVLRSYALIDARAHHRLKH